MGCLSFMNTHGKENEDVNQRCTINFSLMFLKWSNKLSSTLLFCENAVKYKNCYIHLCGLFLFRILFLTNEIALVIHFDVAPHNPLPICEAFY